MPGGRGPEAPPPPGAGHLISGGEIRDRSIADSAVPHFSRIRSYVPSFFSWRTWHEQRVALVSGPYGPLSLTGTLPLPSAEAPPRLSDHPEGRIPAVPGTWPEDGDEVALTATAEDALTVDGQPFTGSVRLAADHAPIPGSRVAHDRRLVVMRREGL